VRYGVGVKLSRQLPEAFPGVHLLGTETLYNQAFPLQARTTGAEGWYLSNVGPDPAARPAAAGWVARFRRRFGADPTTYAMTAYTAAIVVSDAVGRAAAGGRPVTRAAVRDAIHPNSSRKPAHENRLLTGGLGSPYRADHHAVLGCGSDGLLRLLL
jgi:ABC-type branched-subunit amino acid transport system substrate-binding protein